MTSCVRGCTIARQHRTDCPNNDACRGCQPRQAGHGLLCTGCHRRLLSMLDTAPAQHALLLAVTEPSLAHDLTSETTAARPGPRLSSSDPHLMQPARRTHSSGSGEPVRLAALDTAQRLEDILSAWVELLTQTRDLHGPSRQRTTAAVVEGEHGRWRASHWPLDEGEAPDLVWVEPPVRFAVGSAARWLAAQIARLEAVPGIGDLWEELAEVMSQAHALAPWREQAVSLPGIECPCCHRMTLRLYDGDDFVTCLHCRQTVEWARYAIWCREIADRKKVS